MELLIITLAVTAPTIPAFFAGRNYEKYRTLHKVWEYEDQAYLKGFTDGSGARWRAAEAPHRD